jgi:hypothetical protein
LTTISAQLKSQPDDEGLRLPLLLLQRREPLEPRCIKPVLDFYLEHYAAFFVFYFYFFLYASMWP